MYVKWTVGTVRDSPRKITKKVKIPFIKGNITKFGYGAAKENI